MVLFLNSDDVKTYIVFPLDIYISYLKLSNYDNIMRKFELIYFVIIQGYFDLDIPISCYKLNFRC